MNNVLDITIKEVIGYYNGINDCDYNNRIDNINNFLYQNRTNRNINKTDLIDIILKKKISYFMDCDTVNYILKALNIEYRIVETIENNYQKWKTRKIWTL